jgi:uncharacterized protein YjdB
MLKKVHKKLKNIVSAFIIMALWTGNCVPLYAEEVQQENNNNIQTESAASESGEAAEYVSGEVLVFYENDKVSENDIQIISQENNDTMKETVLSADNTTVSVVELSDGRTVEEAVDEYGADPRIDFAIPNYILDTCEDGSPEAQGSVNDGEYASYQWYLDQIQAKGAWDIISQVSHEPVKVAVLDTGADISHPDLVNVINLNESGEILSDQPDGAVGPLKGDGYQLGSLTGATSTHGTHVTGILGAESNNGVGIAGTASAYDNSILDLMVVDVFSGEETTFSYMFKGMEYAKSQGAKIINLSLGYNMNLNSPNIDALIDGTQKVFDAFLNEGIIVVCAAGNSDVGISDNGTITSLPGDLSSTISVINVDRNNQKNIESNYGTLKDVSAPGTDIWSTKNGGAYGSMSGTSMAAPVVTGIAAMMLSVNPDLSFEEVRDILRSTCTDLYTQGVDIYSGYGLVNAASAVKEAAMRAGKWQESSGTASVQYKTHVQTYGWQDWKTDGQMSGTQGQAKRLEGIQIKLDSQGLTGGIEYKTHVQTYGWQDWKTDGQMSGTEGQAKRLEAIQIRLTGQMAEKYDIYYRVHAQTYGWLDWAKNGASAGSSSYAKRLEGIEIKLVEKGGQAPGNTETAYIHPLVKYQTHVQTYGWQGYVLDGTTGGTVGKAKRLEGVRISLTEPQYQGDIEYQTHIQTYGWETNWKAGGKTSGTTGEAKRLEGVRIRLTGEMAEKYDVYYQVHIQSFGWLGWAKNGESAGSAGMAKRMEGIRIVMVPKGGTPPGSVENTFLQK